MNDVTPRREAPQRGDRRVARNLALWVCNRTDDTLWVAVPGSETGTHVRQALVPHDALPLARLRPPLVVHARRLGDPDVRPNGCYLSWDPHHEPPLVVLRTFHYKVEPGAAGTQLGRQPLLLAQQAFELPPGPRVIEVDATFRACLSRCGPDGPLPRRS